MYLYLDTSVLVKRHLAEAGSAQVEVLVGGATFVATARITRAEAAAAFAKAARMGLISREMANLALQAAQAQWPNYVRLDISESTTVLAEALAWEHGLRGYDAVHLACAVAWQQGLGEAVTLATFDRELWQAAHQVGLAVWPEA